MWLTSIANAANSTNSERLRKLCSTRCKPVNNKNLRSYAHAFIEKVCPDVGEETIKAAIKQQNGNDG